MSVQLIRDGKIVSPHQLAEELAAKLSSEEKTALLQELREKYGTKLKSLSTSTGVK